MTTIHVLSHEHLTPDMTLLCWENVIDAEVDINSACSNFTKTFLNIAKTCIPTREVTIRSDDKVWFDSDLRRESRKRDRLRQIFFRTKTETAENKF